MTITHSREPLAKPYCGH